MATPRTTLWPLEPHTQAKHAILDAYLKAWFPILATGYPELLYVDGFCGPGRYQGGEKGSPIVAIEAAKSNDSRIRSRLRFWFSDERKDRIESLTEELEKIDCPKNYDIQPCHGEFDKAFECELVRLEQSKVPAFVFIDPFGFKGISFEFVSRILALESSEVFINIMIDSINRFVEHPNPDIQAHIVEAFGTDSCLYIARTGQSRFSELCRLYQSQLEKVARFVRFFEMLDRHGKPIYYLFFASNSRLGHVKMKEAFWRVDDQFGFRFSDADDPDQPVLFGNEDAWLPVLKQDIVAKFENSEQVMVEEVRLYVEDNTAYLDRHMKHALKGLESEKTIRVMDKKKNGETRRAGTFPDDVIISFSHIQRELF